jgi:hypothetical protein
MWEAKALILLLVPPVSCGLGKRGGNIGLLLVVLLALIALLRVFGWQAGVNQLDGIWGEPHSVVF